MLTDVAMLITTDDRLATMLELIVRVIILEMILEVILGRAILAAAMLEATQGAILEMAPEVTLGPIQGRLATEVILVMVIEMLSGLIPELIRTRLVFIKQLLVIFPRN